MQFLLGTRYGKHASPVSRLQQVSGGAQDLLLFVDHDVLSLYIPHRHLLMLPSWPTSVA